jgi:hypothetical protein
VHSVVDDTHTKEETTYYAKVIFVNAATLNSNLILLNSVSNRFPNGLGNDSGVLGKYVSWHNYRGKANAEYEGFKDKKTDGRNPSNAYIPRFRNVHKQEMSFQRGYAIGIGGGLGWFMLLNVWGIVWRMQKKIIRWTEESAANGTPMPPEAQKLARLAHLAAWTNFVLSFPMLLLMAVASHYPVFRS